LKDRQPLFVVSGPSGAGKGTALDWMASSGLVRRVPTYTTRLPRETETDGVEYNFVTEATFSELLVQGQLIEHTRTYSDSYYGSPRELLDGEDPMPLAVELEPTGYVKVRAMSSRPVIGVFVTTRTESELRSRLAKRDQAKDSDNRLRVRNLQQTWAWVYDYVLVNDDQEDFLRDLSIVVESELIRSRGVQYIAELQQKDSARSYGTER
jgi:guanylate kinase